MMLFVLSLLLASTTPDATQAATAIDAMNASFVTAMTQGDAHTIASHLEADGVYVDSKKKQALHGREAFEAYVAASLKQGRPKSGHCITSHLDVFGKSAFESGGCTFDFATASGAFQYSYHYEAVWHQQPDGAWLLATDVSE